MTDLCNIVANLDLGIEGCIISVNMSSSTEAIAACGESDPKPGPTIGTLSLTAYPNESEYWKGKPAKAGVSIPYIRKYDCVRDIVYFINNGQGQSFTSGNIPHIRLNFPFKDNRIVSASSTAGPSALYVDNTQSNGYGLTYEGGPIDINTAITDPYRFPSILDDADFYLQSFNFDAQPGQIPVVSYSFMYSIRLL